MTRPQIDRSAHVGIGRHAENCRIRRANLSIDRECLVQLKGKRARSRILIMSLRSGAGVDGLQGVCRTAVFGELDWSPGVHEQCVGRLHRDGQDEPCLAYFLVAEHGADPVMVDVLGVKREQIEGVRNPDRALVERIDIGENNIKRVAREFLERRRLDATRSNAITHILDDPTGAVA